MPGPTATYPRILRVPRKKKKKYRLLKAGDDRRNAASWDIRATASVCMHRGRDTWDVHHQLVWRGISRGPTAREIPLSSGDLRSFRSPRTFPGTRRQMRVRRWIESQSRTAAEAEKRRCSLLLPLFSASETRPAAKSQTRMFNRESQSLRGKFRQKGRYSFTFSRAVRRKSKLSASLCSRDFHPKSVSALISTYARVAPRFRVASGTSALATVNHRARQRQSEMKFQT